MGFKCPICFKDFAFSKKDWEDHIANEHNGIGKDVETMVRSMAGEREQENSADVCPCGAPAVMAGWCEECIEYVADEHDPNG